MKKKLLFKGPVLTRSGYGEQSRFALRALRSRTDLFDIFIQPLTWGNTSWVSENDEERQWIDHAIEKTLAYGRTENPTFDVSFQVTIPNEWQLLAPVNVGFTAGIETTKVAHQWIQKANEMDRIVVVSNHAKNVFQDSKYTAQNQNTGESFKLFTTTEIDVVNYPVKSFEHIPIDLELKNDINFLCVAQTSPRKNLPNTVKWFVEEFRDEEVGLIVKTNIAKNCIMDRKKCFHTIREQVLSLGEKKCTVYLLHGDFSDAEMHGLYNNPKVSCLLSLTHGEGFGLPIYEAAYSGLPVICPGWSGQNDFLIDAKTGTEAFYNVEYDLSAIPEQVVWEGVLIKESMWAYPREYSAKQQMRKFYHEITNSPDTVKQKFEEDATRIRSTFTEENQNELMVNVVCKALKLDPSESLDEVQLLEFG
mgnify:FL=1